MKMREISSGYAKKKTLVVVEFAWQKKEKKDSAPILSTRRERQMQPTYIHTKSVCPSNATSPTCLHVCASNATSPTGLHVYASNATSLTCFACPCIQCNKPKLFTCPCIQWLWLQWWKIGGDTIVHYGVYSFNMNQLQKYTPFTVLLWACLPQLDQYVYLVDDDWLPKLI